MSDRPTPLTDAAERTARIGHQALTDGEWPWAAIRQGWDFARTLERQLAEAREDLRQAEESRVANAALYQRALAELAEAKEAMREADTLLAKLGYQPTDLTRAKLAQQPTP